MDERKESSSQRATRTLANTLMGLLIALIVGAALYVVSCVAGINEAFGDEWNGNEWNMFPYDWNMEILDNACQGKSDGTRELEAYPGNMLERAVVVTFTCVNGGIHGTVIATQGDRPMAKIPYVNGKKHGNQVTDHHGTLVLKETDPLKYVGEIETPWENGKKHGTEIWRYKRRVSGDIRFKIPYVNGKKHGTELQRDGAVEIRWANGEKHGMEIRYSFGEPAAKIPWANGKKHGVETNEEGTKTWENGVLVDFTRK